MRNEGFPVSYVSHCLVKEFHIIDNVLITLGSLILESKLVLKPYLSKQHRMEITSS